MIIINTCETCAWRLTQLTCMAYPKEIPVEYEKGLDAHLEVQPKQRGELVHATIGSVPQKLIRDEYLKMLNDDLV